MKSCFYNSPNSKKNVDVVYFLTVLVVVVRVVVVLVIVGFGAEGDFGAFFPLSFAIFITTGST